MKNRVYGRVVKSKDAKSIRPVEVRYALLGDRVRACKNITYLANRESQRLGLKPVKENVIFQAIFDQAVDGLFNPNQVLEIPMSLGDLWELDMSEFESLEAFNLEIEALQKSEAIEDKGSKPSVAADDDELEGSQEVSLDGDAENQTDLELEEAEGNGQVEQEDDELARLEREMNQ